MIDQFGRSIDYMRISVTDRCNLRCRYCMPNGAACEKNGEILRYDELLRICAAAVELGITKFKITGGEPLVRKGCPDFIAALKRLPGVEQVTLTTNGLLLAEHLDALCSAGLDAANVSLDTLNADRYRKLTSSVSFTPDDCLRLLESCCEKGLRTKVNTVLLEENRNEAVSLAQIAQKLPVDVRFIELMPIGYGGTLARVNPDEVLRTLVDRWPDLHAVSERRGNGPAHYYASESLLGRIGFIDAVSHRFCADCNRVRLTSTGQLKPCLCFDSSVELRGLLRAGCTDETLAETIRNAVFDKPRAHCFDARENITEHRMMSEIGG
ncbi:MAG: GTP 3',8-cyclase MoaA [Clostridia bacterium]|nr:GTP 3',8-cyclase MoaA [Clostridia bacterium]